MFGTLQLSAGLKSTTLLHKIKVQANWSVVTGFQGRYR